MLGEKFGHFCLNRLRQQGTRSVAQHLGERVSKRPWLKQLDHGSIGHGVSLLCWRSGGSNTPTIRRLLPVRPSPTSANSSCGAEDVVRLEAVMLKDGHRVAFAPAATLSCPMAEVVAHGIREEVAPAAATLGSSARTIVTG